MADDKLYTVELTKLDLVVLVSEGRALAEGRRPFSSDVVREVLRSVTTKLAAIDCGHGYTVMDSCPMCDAEEDEDRP